jgi:hypothetical protein
MSTHCEGIECMILVIYASENGLKYILKYKIKAQKHFISKLKDKCKIPRNVRVRFRLRTSGSRDPHFSLVQI